MSEEKIQESAGKKEESAPKAEKPKAVPKSRESSGKNGKIAVILIRGLLKIGSGKKATLKMMKLSRKNYCTVLEKTPSIVGMVKKVEECVAWGEIDDSTLKELVSKRGEKTKVNSREVPKKFFRLCPPRGGFERKGIKIPFSRGGAAGYRGEKINDLIRRML